MIDTRGMVTIAEAAKRLDRSVEQVPRKLRAGKLRGQRIGSQWFVDEACLVRESEEDRGYLIPRAFIREIYELRNKIAEENGGHVFDVVEMLRRHRGEL